MFKCDFILAGHSKTSMLLLTRVMNRYEIIAKFLNDQLHSIRMFFSLNPLISEWYCFIPSGWRDDSSESVLQEGH